MLARAGHLFDDATRVTAGDSRWRGRTSDDYWAFVGPFGGLTAATILRALIEHPERRRRSVGAHRRLLRADRARRLRSRRSPGQGQPLDAALVGRTDPGPRRRRGAGDGRIRRAAAVMVAPAGHVSRGHGVRTDLALCQGRGGLGQAI